MVISGDFSDHPKVASGASNMFRGSLGSELPFRTVHMVVGLALGPEKRTNSLFGTPMRIYHDLPKSSFAIATIRLGSKPNFVKSAFNGAEAPKVFIPTIRPEEPM